MARRPGYNHDSTGTTAAADVTTTAAALMESKTVGPSISIPLVTGRYARVIGTGAGDTSENGPYDIP